MKDKDLTFARVREVMAWSLRAQNEAEKALHETVVALCEEWVTNRFTKPAPSKQDDGLPGESGHDLQAAFLVWRALPERRKRELRNQAQSTP